MKPSRKTLFTLIPLLALLGLLVLALLPEPVLVELAVVEQRMLVVEVQEQGRTRARDPYIVAAPIGGRLLRSELDAGDEVEAGQVLARIALPREDSRREAVLQAGLVAAEAREAAARAALLEAQSAQARARSEQERRDELYKNKLASEEEREYYRQASDSADARVLSMQASLQAARAEVESARSQLLGVDYDDEAAVMEVRAPVKGTVYRLYEESERVLQAGAPLLEISNDDRLEIVIDLLTQDAVQVRPGAPVNISGWGGDEALRASVRRIEPEAFTKVSALGVEEQRVNVIADFVGDSAGIGAGYHVEAGIVVWEADRVLAIPLSALFQRGGHWYTYVAGDGRAVLREVEAGRRNREYAQVLSGLSAGDRVIEFPTDIVEDGVRIRER